MPHAVIFKPVTRQPGLIKLSSGSVNCIVLVIIVCLNWKQMQRESFNLRLCRRKWLLLYMESRCFAARFAALNIFLFSQSHVLFLHCIQSTEVKAESERFLCERNAGVTDFFETRTLGFTLQTFSTKEIVTLIPVWRSRPWRLPKKSLRSKSYCERLR